MLTTAVVIMALVGIVLNLVMQTWVSPRWFREDNKRWSDLITTTFNSQLDSLNLTSSNAQKTLDEAASFFRLADERFAIMENRMSLLEQQNRVLHRLVKFVGKLDKRVSLTEGVCAATHERSGRFQVTIPNPDDNDFFSDDKETTKP